jgi:hypothetical protein
MSDERAPATSENAEQEIHIDQHEVELVRKLMAKTNEGKLKWNRTKIGYTTAAPGVVATFAKAADAPSDTWARFLVNTSEGTVLNAENRSNRPLEILGGFKRDPLSLALRELFALVTKVGEGAVDRAIKALDSI